MTDAFYLRCSIACLICLSFFSPSFASDQSTHDAIAATLKNYLDGSSYNQPDQIQSAFYPESDMFLHHGEKPIYRMNSLEYAALFEKRERGVFNGRFGKILDIDVSGNIATAKAEILIPTIDAQFFDIFILKKLDGEWKIISKAADRVESSRSGERLLMIMSAKPQKLSEVIHAYTQATDAGYTVDIASPDGDAVLLRKIDMRNPQHAAFIYDAGFLYALKFPESFDAVEAENYAAAKITKAGLFGNKISPEQSRLYTAICEGNTACSD